MGEDSAAAYMAEDAKWRLAVHADPRGFLDGQDELNQVITLCDDKMFMARLSKARTYPHQAALPTMADEPPALPS